MYGTRMSSLIRARAALLESPLFKSDTIRSLADLRILMEHHVFAVWDFMSLVKALQRELAPTPEVWLPPCDRDGARMINEIVLCEESDDGPAGLSTLSHFEIYLEAMREVGADMVKIERFLDMVPHTGVDQALREASLPISVDHFVQHTFKTIRSKKPWVISAVFAHGREDIIPAMFKRLRRSEAMQNLNCPAFDYYLARHIEVDGGDQNNPGHGALALQCLNRFCDGIAERHVEAERAAIAALHMRTQFWLGVTQQLATSKAIGSV